MHSMFDSRTEKLTEEYSLCEFKGVCTGWDVLYMDVNILNGGGWMRNERVRLSLYILMNGCVRKLSVKVLIHCCMHICSVYIRPRQVQ